MYTRSTSSGTSFIVVLALLLGSACSNPQLQQEGPPAGSRFAVDEGRRLYQHYCSVCHGREGRGDGSFFVSDLPSSPPDFTTPEWASERTDKDLVVAITEGFRARGQSDICPPWGKTFSNAEIRYLVAYIRGLRQREGAIGSHREGS